MPFYESYLFMQHFNLIILHLIVACQFDNLLVKESYIGLVFVGHTLFFCLNFMEGLVQSFHLVLIHIPALFYSLLKLIYSSIPLP